MSGMRATISKERHGSHFIVKPVSDFVLVRGLLQAARKQPPAGRSSPARQGGLSIVSWNCLLFGNAAYPRRAPMIF
jgi:hypothetical protein